MGVALALAGMIAVSLAFWGIAAANPDPEVAEDAWSAGLAYNETVRARRRAQALGITLDVDLVSEPGAVQVRARLQDAAGAPVVADRVQVHRERPAEGGLDADFELVRGKDGFSGRVPLPRPGRWRLAARAHVQGEVLEHSADYWSAVQPDPSQSPGSRP